jgi:hypothetical protein
MGIMIVLHLVKGPVEEELELNDDNSECLHGCKIMLHLLCTTSAVMQLYSKRFRFIGVVKTATCLFRKAYLSTIEMPNCGAVSALIRLTDDCELLALVYCDCDSHYFISTCVNIAGGDPIQHVRLRQIQLVDTYEEPEYQLITHNGPQVAQLYYTACGKIDQHNRCRHSGLSMEKKIRVKSWDKRVNLLIFSIIVVDLFLLHCECTGGGMKQIEYYQALLLALIDSHYEIGVVSWRLAEKQRRNAPGQPGLEGTSGQGLHITPTKRVIEHASMEKRSICSPGADSVA